MTNINDEMKAATNYAIRSAKEKFGKELDFSEQSIIKLDIILGQIYQSFSNQAMNEETNDVISNIAIIWGSYLGEYMRIKWGGTWIRKGSDRFVSIINIEFSPISLVYQKITSHPEYTVDVYLLETKRIIYLSVINSQQSQYMPENIGQRVKRIPFLQSIKNVTIDKRIYLILASIGEILLVIITCIIGYMSIKPGGISTVGKIVSNTSENTDIHIEKTLVTATFYSTSTLYPTITSLPTYTPKPTFTSYPSHTPSLTYTQIVTLTPTETQTPLPPTRTRAPTRSPTSVPVIPTSTPVPPSVPPPTVPPPPPVVIESCEIDPPIVPIGINVTITFIVHFSSPGYGFDGAIEPQYPGQSGCSGSDSDGDGMAYCDGSSGLLPDSTTVYIILSSPVGNCDVSYSSR